MADRVNKALFFGHPLLSDDLWRGEKPDPPKRGWLARLVNCPEKGGTR